ncbi:CsgG/HfaB family protein [Oceanibacterium hippocampi]|uniref:Curli production assembly/transport component CsgG n=1 Tax=Oceanibacterium hippocampi TaxID=745714 RepID=A0A1Y5S9A7_9PROT|nr:CsgG/HfaB family protein [Oceanibacterium hippocampi]SLN35310.1 Curli production assembly/transport component CsgG [Oceanibacterium hippocampi]
MIEQVLRPLTAGLFMATMLAAVPVMAQEKEPITTSGDSDGSLGGTFSGIFGSKAGTETRNTSGDTNSPDINAAIQEAYNGPKARIAVARFTDKTGSGWYNGAIGDGMADQLTTALFHSNRFIVLERQTLGDVLQEQDLGASGRVRESTAARIGEIEGAEILITAAVTEFEGKASGGGGGAGGGLLGSFGTILGAVASSYSRAHIAIDLRLIDTRTSRIVAATSIEGEATDVSMGAALGGAAGGGALGGALGGWKNTPVEKALRIVIRDAVAYISTKMPAQYYRVGPDGRQMQPQTAAIAPAPAAVSAPAASNDRANAPNYDAGTVVRVSSDSLNARSGPGTQFDKVFSNPQGTPLLVLAQSGTWVQVKRQDGQVGWVASWLTYPDGTLNEASFMQAAAPAQAPETREAAPQAVTAPAPAAVTAPAPAPAAAAVDPESPAARLTKLKNLFDQGLIDQQLYDEKRRKILEEL